MVLDSIFTPENAEKHPLYLFIFGFIITIIAGFLSLWIFKDYSTLVIVFLTTLAGVPLVYRTIKHEEKKDLEDLEEKILLKQHSKAIWFFMCFFFGTTLAFATLYVALPGETVSVLFEAQISTLNTINPGSQTTITGNSIGNFNNFKTILFNNLNVTIFCILFSFLYGVGALFILTWNASVIGVAIGNLIRSNLAAATDVIGLERVATYFNIVTYGLLRYIIHGIPEILGYFFAGFAGGIISVAVIKHNMTTRKFEHVVMDSTDLILISLGLIVAAAVLEVYLTPLIF
jgi:uncharacterized membrane protein SpoIIM required for sporulation